jgi:hypothetical protein
MYIPAGVPKGPKGWKRVVLQPVLRIRIRIRIHRIQKFLSLLDPDPDPSISKNSKKNLDFSCFVTSFWRFMLKNDIKIPPKSKMQENF